MSVEGELHDPRGDTVSTLIYAYFLACSGSRLLFLVRSYKLNYILSNQLLLSKLGKQSFRKALFSGRAAPGQEVVISKIVKRHPSIDFLERTRTVIMTI